MYGSVAVFVQRYRWLSSMLRRTWYSNLHAKMDQGRDQRMEKGLWSVLLDPWHTPTHACTRSAGSSASGREHERGTQHRVERQSGNRHANLAKTESVHATSRPCKRPQKLGTATSKDGTGRVQQAQPKKNKLLPNRSGTQASCSVSCSARLGLLHVRPVHLDASSGLVC